VKDPKTIPAYYAILFQGLADVARECGYALSLHGSLARDMDLIAVPWIEDAVPADQLVEALCVRAGARMPESRQDAERGDFTGINPQPKPHGRLAWSIQFGGGPYIDLSVMPRGGA